MIFDLVTLTLQVDLLLKNVSRTMTFESEGLLIVSIYIWLLPASYVVFLTTFVKIGFNEQYGSYAFSKY